ncbi:MAG: hypothetical protein C0508_17485 [Cyanobacteria bacterium PR.023]|jgi:hypothetical protein|nr:hypothetical protein [Cyanobacteria bacterium PR.023]
MINAAGNILYVLWLADRLCKPLFAVSWIDNSGPFGAWFLPPALHMGAAFSVWMQSGSSWQTLPVGIAFHTKPAPKFSPATS